MGRVTSAGYQRKTLPEIVTSLRDNVKIKLGNDWTVDTGSITDQFLAVFAVELDSIEQGIESVVAAQTLNGAEDVYLDNILNQQGVYRQGKTKGGGYVVLNTNYVNATGVTVPITTNILSSVTATFKLVDPIVIDKYCGAYSLSATQITVGQLYTFNVYNTVASGSAINKTFTASSDADKNRCLQELVDYLNTSVLDRTVDAWFDSVERIAYIGYNNNKTLNPYVGNILKVDVTPAVGIISHVGYVQNTVAEYRPVAVGQITNINPTYTGYISATNYVAFDAGRDVMTDAEFRSTASQIKNSSVSGTEDAVLAELLNIEGVTTAKVYTNPEFTRLKDWDQQVICEPYTYNVVVQGGLANKIVQAIYDKAPFNTKSFGKSSGTAFDKNGNSVTIKYTPCNNFNFAVRVRYTTKNNTVLTEAERNSINQLLRDFTQQMNIGEWVNIDWLKSAVYQAVPFGRFTTIELSLCAIDSTTAFTPYSLPVRYDERPRVDISKTEFIRI